MSTTQPLMSTEGFSSLAGMSKGQLYDIMSEMKLLIDQNKQQAKQILTDNPLLTRALFQAQIMLGMVQPTHVTPNIQQALSQPQSAQAEQQSRAQTTQPLPVQSGSQGQSSSSQSLVSPRQQQPPQPSISLPSASLAPVTIQPQTEQSNPPHSAQQAKGFVNSQLPPASASQSSQTHNVPLPPPPAAPHYSVLQPHLPTVSNQAQPSLQIPGVFNQPLQPPLPQHPRPSSMQPFSHQYHSQIPHNLAYQPSNAHQQLLSQPMFHPGNNHPSSFPQGQPPLPSQPPPQQFYQGGAHMGGEYNNQAGKSMQTERGAPWLPGLPEKSTGGLQLPGPPPQAPGQMGPGSAAGQPPHPPPLTREMEKLLLEQVMSLTPEQINLLPPEQRNQVLQLQEMLR